MDARHGKPCKVDAELGIGPGSRVAVEWDWGETSPGATSPLVRDIARPRGREAAWLRQNVGMERKVRGKKSSLARTHAQRLETGWEVRIID